MDLINLFTNPMWIFYSVAFPVLMILILGFLLSGSYGDKVSSYDYYGVSLMIYSTLNAATISANSFMEERIKNANMRIVYSPVRPFYIHFSKVLASFIFCCVCYLIAGIIVHLLVGVNFGGIYLPQVILLMALSIFFMSALGVLMCCIFKSESTANQLLSLVITLLALLGGIFFPPDSLGKAISAISWISPVKWILTAIMQFIYDANLSMLLPSCGVLILLTVLAVFLSTRFFKEEEYL